MFEEYAKGFVREKNLELARAMLEYADKVNEDWVPDWTDAKQEKWHCCYAGETYFAWTVSPAYRLAQPGTAYFKTEELARACLVKVVHPFVGKIQGGQERL